MKSYHRSKQDTVPNFIKVKNSLSWATRCWYFQILHGQSLLYAWDMHAHVHYTNRVLTFWKIEYDTLCFYFIISNTIFAPDERLRCDAIEETVKIKFIISGTDSMAYLIANCMTWQTHFTTGFFRIYLLWVELKLSQTLWKQFCLEQKLIQS